MNIFEQASRRKLRFTTPNGIFNVDDLWDLPLTTKRANVVSLDSVAVALYKEIQSQPEVTSFVQDTAVSVTATDNDLRFELVKYVIEIKKAEEAARRDANLVDAQNAARKQQIASILGEKDLEDLKGKSREELMAEYNKL